MEQQLRSFEEVRHTLQRLANEQAFARKRLKGLNSDLSLVTERKIPGWVDGAIYGTVLIFWSFTVVQIIFQYLPPGFYWGSELIYCVLSLSAKLYLGFFLLMNVILTDGTVEQALAPTEGGTQ